MFSRTHPKQQNKLLWQHGKHECSPWLYYLQAQLKFQQVSFYKLWKKLSDVFGRRLTARGKVIALVGMEQEFCKQHHGPHSDLTFLGSTMWLYSQRFDLLPCLGATRNPTAHTNMATGNFFLGDCECLFGGIHVAASRALASSLSQICVVCPCFLIS